MRVFPSFAGRADEEDGSRKKERKIEKHVKSNGRSSGGPSGAPEQDGRSWT